ncbi:hypothetical protein [Pendulispora albinea]|uniref:Uncharacterized protein n=1 Tax=Pendulispora albinea TaxID=2741071 RepID=A0ABZ2M9Z6_9BACT
MRHAARSDPASLAMRDIASVLRSGVGDGRELLAWRVAELRERQQEYATAIRVPIAHGIEDYVLVERADGHIEDPRLLMVEPSKDPL